MRIGYFLGTVAACALGLACIERPVNLSELGNRELTLVRLSQASAMLELEGHLVYPLACPILAEDVLAEIDGVHMLRGSSIGWSVTQGCEPSNWWVDQLDEPLPSSHVVVKDNSLRIEMDVEGVFLERGWQLVSHDSEDIHFGDELVLEFQGEACDFDGDPEIELFSICVQDFRDGSADPPEPCGTTVHQKIENVRLSGSRVAATIPELPRTAQYNVALRLDCLAPVTKCENADLCKAVVDTGETWIRKISP